MTSPSTPRCAGGAILSRRIAKDIQRFLVVAALSCFATSSTACGKKPRKSIAPEVVGSSGKAKATVDARTGRALQSVTAGGVTPAEGTPRAVKDAMFGLATQKSRSTSVLITLGAEARPAAIQLLKSDNLNEISGALSFFNKHPTEAPWSVIAQLLSHDAPEIRDGALAALAAHGDLKHAAAVSPLLSHANSGVRAHALRYLGRSGARDYVQPMVKLLNDPDRDVANAAVAALAKVGDASLGPKLIAASKEAKAPQAARSALAAARRLGIQIPADTIMRHVASPDAALSVEASRHLARLAAAERANGLKKKPGLATTTSYLESLAQNSAPDARAEALATAKVLLTNSAPPSRVLALRTLAAVAPEAAIEQLIAASSKDASEAVRAAAVALLSDGKPSPAKRLALKKVATGDSDAATRHLALYALLRSPDRESLTVVIDRLATKEDGGSAWLALTRLRGTPLPKRRGPWEGWRDSKYPAPTGTPQPKPTPAATP